VIAEVFAVLYTLILAEKPLEIKEVEGFAGNFSGSIKGHKNVEFT